MSSKAMVAVFTTLVIFILYVGELHSENCWERTTSCPESKDRWQIRKKEFNCSKKYTDYTCLLNKDGELVETCIHQISVGKNVVGCPFLMLCLGGYPQIGTENKYMECPEGIPLCPQKGHEVYTLHEMYKHPVCFYRNKSEAINLIPGDRIKTVPSSTIITTTITTETSVGIGIELLIVIIALTLLTVSLITAFLVIRRKCCRKFSTLSTEEESMLEMESEMEMTYTKLRRDLYLKNVRLSRKIPMSPLDKTDKIPLDNLYSSVIVLGQKETLQSLGRQVEQRVESPKDIFYITKSNKTRCIFMIGHPARGKTTYCQWLSHNWCNAKEKKGKDMNEWEEGLYEFDFLFFVKLRNIATFDSLANAIWYDLFKDDPVTAHDVNEVLMNANERCLIILDGLDELKSECTCLDIEMSRIRNCVTFFTTRPWRYADVSHLIDDNDKVLEIKGLDDEGIRNVTEKVLCNYFHLDKSSNDFLHIYETITRKWSSSALKSFMHIPLLAIICVQILYDTRLEEARGMNMTGFYINLIDLLIKRAHERGQIRFKTSLTYPATSTDLKLIIPSRYKTIHEYSEALSRLAKLAFDGLISKRHEFVKNLDDIEEDIGKDKFQFALDVGLLSQSDERVSFNNVNVRISFFHTTVQEMLAAVHIAVVLRHKFINHLTNVKTILDYAYVIMFLSGLEPNLGKDILQHVTYIVNKDENVTEYRDELMSTSRHALVSTIFKLQLDCFREMKYQSFTGKENINIMTNHVTDIVLTDDDNYDHFINFSEEILYHNSSSIKSACFLRAPSGGRLGISDGLLTRFLDEARTLKSLHISGYGQTRILHHLTIPTLTFLSLTYVSISDVNPADETFSLTPLLNDMKSLEVLKLNHITLGNKSLGLSPKMTNLKCIVLQWVEMCLWGRFFQSLSAIKHKYTVQLSYTDIDSSSLQELFSSSDFQITWHGGKARTHFIRISFDT